MYIYENKKFPNFLWNTKKIKSLLSKVKLKQAYLLGKMEILDIDTKEKALLNILTEDIIKSSEIEGQILNIDQVRSSIAKQLSIKTNDKIKTERNIDGIVDTMLDAIRNFTKKKSLINVFTLGNPLCFQMVLEAFVKLKQAHIEMIQLE